MTKHTKGPWTVAAFKMTETMRERCAVGTVHWAVAQDTDPTKAEGLLVALCGDDPGESTSKADALLMAASPELADALAAYVEGDECEADNEKHPKGCRYCNAMAALVKAGRLP